MSVAAGVVAVLFRSDSFALSVSVNLSTMFLGALISVAVINRAIERGQRVRSAPLRRQFYETVIEFCENWMTDCYHTLDHRPKLKSPYPKTGEDFRTILDAIPDRLTRKEWKTAHYYRLTESALTNLLSSINTILASAVELPTEFREELVAATRELRSLQWLDKDSINSMVMVLELQEEKRRANVPDPEIERLIVNSEQNLIPHLFPIFIVLLNLRERARQYSHVEAAHVPSNTVDRYPAIFKAEWEKREELRRPVESAPIEANK